MNDIPRRGSGPTFLRSGGWVLLAALTLTGVVFAFHVASLLGSRSHALGDGRHAASYGFDLSATAVPAQEIVATGMPKDGLPALVNPAVWTLPDAEGRTAKRSKFLVPSDRVIGVVLGGSARAYPLRLLVWHEVVNDTLDSRPIAVTYNPLCDSAAVFDRAGSPPLVFGVSGLLYQSNLLMFDRRPGDKGESLWSQLLFQPVAGPAVRDSGGLSVLPCSVVTWADWQAAHPATTVLAPDPRLHQQYKRDPYSSYFSSDILRFPVRPLPPPESGPLKTAVIAVSLDGVWHAFPYPALFERADKSGRWSTNVGNVPLDFRIRREHPQTVEVSSPGRSMPTVYAFLFAWTATHGQDTVWHH